MKRFLAIVSILGCFAVAVGAFMVPAAAHFLLNINIRTIHVIHEDDKLRLLVRLPMPYLVADKLGAVQDDGLPHPAPYTTNAFENGNLVHFLNADKLRSDPSGLGLLLSEGIELTIDGMPQKAMVGRVTGYPLADQPPFASKTEAEAALLGPIFDPNFPTTFVGDTVVDVELIYPVSAKVTNYQIRSTLNPGLPKQEETANLIIDHSSDKPLVFRFRGLLSEPVMIGQSAFSAFLTFIWEGARHVLEGLDHVLFIFCLVLGATTLAGLAWRVTGFTIGHSITLSLGFFGFVPTATWFVPLVETGIAASIIYAALVAIFHKSDKSTLLVTSLIGLLHGLGFSFVLQEILNIDGPHIWQSLLAFNIGIEIGQIVFAAAIWGLLAILTNKFFNRINVIKAVLATPCVVIAAIWVGERTVLFYSQL